MDADQLNLLRGKAQSVYAFQDVAEEQRLNVKGCGVFVEVGLATERAYRHAHPIQSW
jgi:hypothetical protein